MDGLLNYKLERILKEEIIGKLRYYLSIYVEGLRSLAEI
jgi:hypothetical protein